MHQRMSWEGNGHRKTSPKNEFLVFVGNWVSLASAGKPYTKVRPGFLPSECVCFLSLCVAKRLCACPPSGVVPPVPQPRGGLHEHQPCHGRRLLHLVCGRGSPGPHVQTTVVVHPTGIDLKRFLATSDRFERISTTNLIVVWCIFIFCVFYLYFIFIFIFYLYFVHFFFFLSPPRIKNIFSLVAHGTTWDLDRWSNKRPRNLVFQFPGGLKTKSRIFLLVIAMVFLNRR